MQGAVDGGRSPARREVGMFEVYHTGERAVQARRHPRLQEAGQQDLVEVGVLDADDVLVGAAQPLPVQDGVAG